MEETTETTESTETSTEPLSQSPMDLYNRVLVLTRLVYGNFTRMSKMIGRSQASFERYKYVYPSELVFYNIQRQTGFSSKYIQTGEGYPLANNEAGYIAYQYATKMGSLQELEALTNEKPPFDLENPNFDETDQFKYKSVWNLKQARSEGYKKENAIKKFQSLLMKNQMREQSRPELVEESNSTDSAQRNKWVLDENSPIKFDGKTVGELLAVPLFDVNARANIGTLASFDDLPVSTVKLAVGLRLNPTQTVGIKVRGDSMSEAGIVDGSIVLVDRSKTVANGSGVACLFNGVLLVKVFEKNVNDVVYLVSKHQNVPPIIVKDTDTLEIIGVIRAVLNHWS